MPHTPGPWKFVEDGTVRSLAFLQSDLMGDCTGCIICDLKPSVGCDQWPGVARHHAVPEAVANARLIAAAPDLLAACKEALQLAERAIAAACDDPQTEAIALASHPVLLALRTAIAKATQS